MGQIQDKYVIRFPIGMRADVKKLAKKNKRTMNAELIFCIENYLNTEKEKGAVEAATSPRHVQESQPASGDCNNEQSEL